MAMLAACSARQEAERSLEPLPAQPLAAYTARPLLVLPVRYLRPADSLGWAAQIPESRAYLQTLDSEIAFAVGERGVKELWVFPDELARSVRRNANYAPDPYTLAAQSLRPPMRRLPELLTDPLAAQLRSLVALHDARYGLIPVEIRFERASAGNAGRAVLHLVLVDARLAKPIWMGEVVSDTMSSFSPALAASIAERLADLVGSR